MNAGMEYMERHKPLRRDPRLLLEGAKTLISVAFNYRQHNPRPEVATYALGEDYHNVLRKRLKTVTSGMKESFGGDYRVCIDSAPVLERYWAVRCGLGRRSSLSGNVMVPGVGSMVFLAEILTTLEIPSFSRNLFAEDITEESIPTPSAAVCPTGALQPDGTVDARRCVNYLTIEHTGEWTPEQRRLMERPGVKGKVFGCDICQLACPSNRGVPIEVLPEFLPLPQLPDLIEALKNGDPDCPDLKKSPLHRRLRNMK